MDFTYFCTTYLRIVDKDGNLVSLYPNTAQIKYLKTREINPWVYVLKARKLGLTTIIAAWNFWKTLFTPNFNVFIVAHTDDAAKSIFRIYKRYYDNLPPFLKFPVALQNLHEFMLEHGGYIRAGTSGSESARGHTFQSIHCSEFAMYADIESTIAAVLSTAGENATVALETTANGLNDAHKIWYGNNGFEKLFISWADAPECTLKSEPETMPVELDETITKYSLSKPQAHWAAYTYMTRCASNWNTFCQEYPIEASVAFITSGKRFFTSHIFPHAKAHAGYRQTLKPQKYHIYTMGVDTASGSDVGDYSAFCVLDVTNKRSPRIASTFYGHLPPAEFARQVLIEAKKYNALICPESNSYGLSVIEYLVSKEWAFMYRRTKYDRIQKRWTENMGFSTNVNTRSVLLARMQEYVSREWLEVTDERLKAEINTFVFNNSGKPEADTGHHDDMIFATALALIALEQVDLVKDEIQRDLRPTSVKDILMYEIATGKLYSQSQGEFDGPGKGTTSAPSTALHDKSSM